MSLRSIWRMTPPYVVAFRKYCTLCAFWGHVTRFHGNHCHGNQEKCVFWKHDTKFILAVYWKFSSISHHFRVICESTVSPNCHNHLLPISQTHSNTVLPATRQRRRSRNNPSRSWYSIHRPRRDERLSWPEHVGAGILLKDIIRRDD